MTYTVGKHIQRVRTAVASDEATRSSVVASWRRCTYNYGLDPSGKVPRRLLSGGELKASTERLEPMLFAATATLDRLQSIVVGMSCCILLAGLDGVPAHWRGRDADIDDLRQLGLWPGVDWSEQHEGTNGIGTCLVEKREMAIQREDHFHARDVELSCVVAPIFDHRGQVAAALDIAYYGSAPSDGLIGLLTFAVREAAWEIEAANFRQAFGPARLISVPDTTRACVGLIAVDDDDMVLGATRAARQTLGVTDMALRDGIPAADLPLGAICHGDTIANAERGTFRRTLARTKGNISAAAKVLDISRATMKRKVKQYDLRRPV
ncbi:sigma-54-dependent Fis family transcriptional regulator [Acidisoma cellulosilytica]|uniref:Sigma-54-dependent Fis family transcriptional regulator n=1 Tax=Acidisoma cellulosilyticum TaxID=2802395 RepID=A0A963Z3L9_9PROT|nr:helix-turn-helix domain-containing protein [Acidisoma cellulosilyticum]MCB8882265.1 sigma-54-dependent Fis family transcriptional regulator [Acidisoma cellulosilyticum]